MKYNVSNLAEFERICDDMAILEKGKTALSGTVSELKAKRSGSDLVTVFTNDGHIFLVEKVGKSLSPGINFRDM